ncbi:hypothetical protein [Streptomyces sp. NPDC002133]|uniref:hypothetical protein n=1 Tax=Streptomyces sp. NPDC002133 TaxID=3154409 RepID=UPI00332EC0DC
MWVGVAPDNEPALAAHISANAANEGEFTLLTWDFTDGEYGIPAMSAKFRTPRGH